MSKSTDHVSPDDAYKAIIDELVRETSRSISASLVLDGAFSKAPAAQASNKFVASLTPDQQSLLANMLREERQSAIHDVLAVISWWVDCCGLGLTIGGSKMPVDLSGAGLHGDYIGRRDGWEWPQS